VKTSRAMQFRKLSSTVRMHFIPFLLPWLRQHLSSCVIPDHLWRTEADVGLTVDADPLFGDSAP